MSIVVKHRGYYGVIAYSHEDELYVARVVGIGNSSISCHGDTLEEAKEEFKVSIEFHLEISEAEGWPPCATDPVVAREMESYFENDSLGGQIVMPADKEMAFAH